MRWHHLGVVALLLLPASSLKAGEQKDKPAGKDRLEVWGAKLGLSDEQMKKIRHINADYDEKEDRIETEIRNLRRSEMESAAKILDEKQLAKAKEFFKEAVAKELNEAADKLGLSGEQKEKIAKIRAEFAKKIHDLEERKDAKTAAELPKLRREEMQAIGQVLTEEQRAKVPGVLREELQEWRNPAETRQRLEAFADKLDLSREQREKLQQLHKQHDLKLHDLTKELRDLHAEERRDMEEVLTDEQREKMRDFLKGRKEEGR